MFVLKKIGCRILQAVFRAVLPIMPYREPCILPSCTALGEVLEREKCTAVLVVTSAGMVKRGMTAALEEIMTAKGVRYEIYGKTQPDPTVDNVEDALKVYKDNGCDTLIALGGGSAMDCAKAIGARVAYPKRTVGQMGGVLRVFRKIPTLIAIPTTAGTGSEVTLAAVVTDSQTHRKYAIMSFPLIPKYAVLDATLTYSLPPSLTATTGMDALTHAVEAYVGRSVTKETASLALEATKLVFENVERACLDGNDHVARENMLHAAYKAGIAFSKSYVGYVHAVAHSLGGKYGTPHGLANAVILPYLLEAYGKCAYKRLYELGIAAGVCNEQDACDEGARKFIAAIRALNERINIPQKISGIKREDISEMAKRAEKEANPLYPVPKLMTAKELETIYESVGELD